MYIQPLLTAVSTFGWYGVLVIFIILLLVFAIRKAGVIVTGDQARLANLLLSIVLFGLSPGTPADNALQAALASVASALIYELLKWVSTKRKR